ncbi:MAG: hypothetical protein LQ340_006820 [Diploschistes diacapsis]|nr:MAG: hypothetical protein LQ340_006820 [Diploschistes diacapsis]
MADINSTFNGLGVFPYTLDTGKTIAVLASNSPSPVPTAFLKGTPRQTETRAGDLVFNLKQPRLEHQLPIRPRLWNFYSVLIQGRARNERVYLDNTGFLKQTACTNSFVNGPPYEINAPFNGPTLAGCQTIDLVANFTQ